MRASSAAVKTISFTCLLLCSVAAPASEPLVVTHFSGVIAGRGYDDGAQAQFAFARGLAVGADGRIFVSDSGNGTIRVIDGASVATLSGNPLHFGYADGSSAATRFNYPGGLAVLPGGGLVVADSQNHVLRAVTPRGWSFTLAGTPQKAGDVDGRAAIAKFYYPQAVAIAPDGAIFVSESVSHVIRKVVAGRVTTLAGLANTRGSVDAPGPQARFDNPLGLAVDASGNLYVADRNNHTIRRISVSGVVTTVAGKAGVAGYRDGAASEARFNFPVSLAITSGGDLYIGENSGAIRKLSADGFVTTVAGTATILGIVDGVGATARFRAPIALAAAPNGDVIVSDNCAIRRITSAGVVTTIASRDEGWRDGSPDQARYALPYAIAIHPARGMFVADTYNHVIRKLSADGSVSTYAGKAREPGSADGTLLDARFDTPGGGIAAAPDGTLYVCDYGNNAIRRIGNDGVVSTLAGSKGTAGWADGTGSQALFRTPEEIATDSSGNIYVADKGNHVIRKVTPQGGVTTIAGSPGVSGSADGQGAAARFYFPAGVAVDSSGNVYVSDTSNHTIRRIDPSGVVTTIAGAPGKFGYADGTRDQARFNAPWGISIDRDGTLLVAELNNNRIRRVTPDGVVTTVAGSGAAGALDGVASAASFSQPAFVAALPDGSLLVADSASHSIRKIAPSSLTDIATAATDTVAPASAVQLTAKPATASSLAWRGVVRPVGSTASLDGATTASPSFTPDRAGVYEFELDARSSGTSLASRVRIVADCASMRLPSITSSASSAVCAGSSVTLQASGSFSDLSWSTGAAGASMTFQPQVTQDVTAIAFDGECSTAAATMRVEVTPLLTAASTWGDAPSRLCAPATQGRFRLQVDGGGASTYQWQYQRIGETSATPIAGATRREYEPQLAHFSRDGVYAVSCRIVPSCGSTVTSSPMMIIVGSCSEPLLFDRRLVAGADSSTGYADGPAESARFNAPRSIAVDPQGITYVADSANHVIRRVDRDGFTTTIAGMYPEHGSADGVADAARFNRPMAVALDPAGTMFVADADNHEVRAIDGNGRVTTVAGAPDRDGYQDGPPAIASFRAPSAIAPMGGDLIVADEKTCLIRRIAGGAVSTVAGSADNWGSDDGPVATAKLGPVYGLMPAADGSILFVDSGSNTVRRINGGVVDTYCGVKGNPGVVVDGPADKATFFEPLSIIRNGDGSLLVGENNRIRRIDNNRNVSTVTGGSQGYRDGSYPAFWMLSGIGTNARGDIIVSDTQNNTIRKFDGATVTTLAGRGPIAGSIDGIGEAARISAPGDLAFGSDGVLYVVETGGAGAFRMIEGSVLSTIIRGSYPGGDGPEGVAGWSYPWGMAVDANGTIYFTDPNLATVKKVTIQNGVPVVRTIGGKSGEAGYVDGTAAESRFDWPYGIAFVPDLGVLVAELQDGTIRRITPDGRIETFAGIRGVRFPKDGPRGTGAFRSVSHLAADSAGNLLVLDDGSIRKVTKDGTITTLPFTTGGYTANGFTLDPHDNIYTVDDKLMVHRFTPDGVHSVIGGPIAFGGIAVDASGRVYYSDWLNHDVYVLEPQVLSDRAAVDVETAAAGPWRTLSVANASATQYRWSIQRLPAGSRTTLRDADTAHASFAPDLEGLYEFKLVSSVGNLSSSSVVRFRALPPHPKRRATPR